MDQTARGDKLLGAETKPQQQADVAEFARMLIDNSKQQVAEAAFVGSKPTSDGNKSVAENKAAAETSAKAETEWKATQRAGAAQADTKVANLKDASPVGVQVALEERNKVIDAIRHNPVEAAVVDPKAPSKPVTTTSGETGADVLDRATPPKMPPSSGLAPAAPATSEESKPATTAKPAPVSPAPSGDTPSGQKDVSFNAEGTNPTAAPRAPVTAMVSSLPTAARSPVVTERPINRLARAQSIAAGVDANFSDVPAAQTMAVGRATGMVIVPGTTGAPSVAAPTVAPLGLDHKPGISVDMSERAAKAAAVPVQASTAKPKAQYSMTVGTSGIR